MNVRLLIALFVAIGWSGCLSRPVDLPRQIFASYKKARSWDLIELPVAIVGTFEGVSTKPFMNVHSEEWGAIFRVRKVFFDSWHEETFSFNISLPEQAQFVAGKDYYVIAIHTRHGFYPHETFPVPPTAAQSPGQPP